MNKDKKKNTATGINFSNLIKVKLNHSNHNSSTSHLKLTYWNARSIKNKTIIICDYLSSNMCDLLAVSETWLYSEEEKNEVVLAQLLPNDFSINHNPRSDGREGGGVAIMYNENTPLEIKNSINPANYKQFESMSNLILFKGSPVRLSVVYRPQPTKINKLKVRFFWSEWTKYLSEHMTRSNDFVIVGDLNFHLDEVNDPHTIRFQSILTEFGLKQHVTSPTHAQGHTLDVVITPAESSLLTSVKVVDLGLANDFAHLNEDHFGVEIVMKGGRNTPKSKTATYRDWKNIDQQTFETQLYDTIQNATPAIQ